MNTVLEDRGALRPKEAATWLGMSRDTFDRLAATGALRTYKVGFARFVSMRELERFIAEREAEANA